MVIFTCECLFTSFTIMRLSTHCYALCGFGYIPPWTVNTGFIAGSHTTLIVDTGPNALAAATVYGYVQALSASKHIIAINTEKHLDHLGGNGFMRERGIDIMGHPGISRQQEDIVSDIDEFNTTVSNHVRREKNEGAIPYRNTRIVNPNLSLPASMSIDLGGISASIVLTPGHTNTNIAIFLQQDGVLYSGDTIVGLYLPNLEASGSDEWRLWLDSLTRIEELEPRIVVPTHGPVLRGCEVKSEIGRIRAVLETALRLGYPPTLPQ